MTQHKHTQGPFHREGCAIMAGKVQVGLVLRDSFGNNPCPASANEVKANGDLFTAAPELLIAAQKALECILKHVPANVFAPRLLLQEAIAKATKPD